MRIRWKHKLGTLLLLVLSCALVLPACNNETKDVDVSHISLDLKIRRFEQAISKLNIDSLEHQIPKIQDDYGEFFTFFAAGIINIGRKEDPSFNTALMGFVNDPQINDVLDEVTNSYADLTSLEEELEDAFKHYLFYFPGKSVPNIVTYISGFNASLIATDKTLGIGLDMYLGSKTKYYRMLMLPQYKIENMRAEMIVSDCMRGWITSEWEAGRSNSTLLKQMIEQGKILYFLDNVIPYTEDKYKIGFTQEQLIWCEDSEAQMWAHLVNEEMLYTTDFTQIIKYIGEAPFTVGFPDGSPGRTGWWIGWQIVKSFMSKNDEISLAELMDFDDLTKKARQG